MAEGPDPSAPTTSSAGTRVKKEALPKLLILLSPVVCSWDLFAQLIGVPPTQISQIKAVNPKTGPRYLYTCFTQALEWWEANHGNPVYESMIGVLDPGVGKVTPVMNRALASELREFMAKQRAAMLPTAATGTHTASPQLALTTVEEDFTRMNESIIQGKFASLLQFVEMKLQQRLGAEKIKRELRLFIIRLFNIPESSIPISSDVAVIFEAMRSHKLLNYLNVDGLEQVIKQFCEGDSETESKMEQYRKDRSGFELATKIKDYISKARSRFPYWSYRTASELQPKRTPAYLTELAGQLKLYYVAEHHLDYLQELWKSLSHIMSLPPLYILLDTVVDDECVYSKTEPTAAKFPMATAGTLSAASDVQAPTTVKEDFTQLNESIIQGKFASLLQFVQMKLQQKLGAERIKCELRLFVIRLYNLPESSMPISSDVAVIFEAMRNHKLLNYLNVRGLEQVIKIFCEGDSETESKMEQYRKDRSGFELATKIKEYISKATSRFPYWSYKLASELQPKRIPAYLTELAVKLEQYVAEHHLDYLQELWKSLSHIMSLPPLYITLDAIILDECVYSKTEPTAAKFPMATAGTLSAASDVQEMKGEGVIADHQLGSPERLKDEKLRVKAAEMKVSSLERNVDVLEEQAESAEEKARMAEEFKVKVRETEEYLQQSKQRERELEQKIQEEKNVKEKADEELKVKVDAVLQASKERERELEHKLQEEQNAKERVEKENLALLEASGISEWETKFTKAERKRERAEKALAELQKKYSAVEDRATTRAQEFQVRAEEAAVKLAEAERKLEESSKLVKEAEDESNVLKETLVKVQQQSIQTSKTLQEMEKEVQRVKSEREEVEQKIEFSKQQIETAETKAATAEKRAQDSEAQAKFPLKTLTEFEMIKDEATKKAKEADQRVQETDKIVQQAEEAQREAELRVQTGNQKLADLESETAEARRVADEYRLKAEEAEIAAQRAEEARQSLEEAMTNAAEESKRNIQEREQAVQILNQELSETKSAAAEAELKVQELEIQNQKLEKEVQTLRETMTDVAERNKKRADELDKQIQESEQRLRVSENTRKTEVEECKQRLQEAENKIQSLQEALAEESRNTREREEEIQMLKRAHSDKEDSTKRAIEELDEKLQEVKESLTQTRATTAQELSQAETQIQLLKEKISDATEVMQAGKQKAEKEIEDLKAAMTIAEEEASGRIKELEDRAMTADEEIDELKEALAQAESEAEEITNKLKQTESEVHDLNGAMLSAEKDANHRIRELEGKLSKARTEAELSLVAIQNTESELRTAKAEVQSLKNKLINAEELIKNDNDEIESLKETLEKEMEERKQMEKEIQALRDKIRELQERVQEIDDESKNLTENLAQAGEKSETQDAKIQGTEAKLIHAQTDIQTLEETLDVSETGNQEAVKEIDSLKQTLASTQEERNQTVEHLQESYREEKHVKEEAQNEVQDLTESLQIAQSEADDKIQDLTESLQKAESEAELETTNFRLKENLRTTDTESLESKRAESTADVLPFEEVKEKPYTQAYLQLQAEKEMLQEESRESHEIIRTSDVKTTEYLRGVEVIAGTRFLTEGRHPQTFEWKNHGLKISIPELSDGVELAIDIKAGLAGQFKLPAGAQLVSPVYWLCCMQKFEHPVTLEIQHCAVIQNQTECSTLQFVAAKCSQKVLPYIFKPLKHGKFSEHSSFGSIEVKQFSIFAITNSSESSESSTPPRNRMYFTQLYYIVKGVNKWQLNFIMSWNLELCIEAIRSEYSGSTIEPGPDMLVQFKKKEKEEISLDIPKDGITENGWKIIPLFPPVITKQQVDEFKRGQRIPSCQFQVKWVAKGSPEEWNSAITLDGAEEPFVYLTICLPPIIKAQYKRKRPVAGEAHEADTDPYKKKRLMAGDAHEASTVPQLKDLVLMGVKKWYNLGLHLDLEVDCLEKIKSDNHEKIEVCQREMFRTWLDNQMNPTYKQLVKALDAIGEKKEAKQLCKKHGIEL